MSDTQQRLRRMSDDTILCRQLVRGESFMQRFRGLMGRATLPEGEGLYLNGNSIHMMFMRFPIDALFVSKADGDGRRRVMSVHHDLPTWRGIVLPVRGAEGVVEMPAGTLARHAVQEGDEVVMESAADDAAGKSGVSPQ